VSTHRAGVEVFVVADDDLASVSLDLEDVEGGTVATPRPLRWPTVKL